MKKAILSIILLLLPSFATAYEIVGNPDRKISFGFNYDHSYSNSEYNFQTFKINDFTKVTDNAFLLDVKLPLSSLFTFQLRGGIFNGTNDIFTGEKVESKGFEFGFGFRVYIP